MLGDVGLVSGILVLVNVISELCLWVLLFSLFFSSCINALKLNAE